MNQVVITINTENDAFVAAPHLEVARILRNLADKLEDGCGLDEFPCMDINGNKVGELTLD